MKTEIVNTKIAVKIYYVYLCNILPVLEVVKFLQTVKLLGL
jgi:hypothetical protein